MVNFSPPEVTDGLLPVPADVVVGLPTKPADVVVFLGCIASDDWNTGFVGG